MKAEYGGEMLYVNKSEHHPMIQTEYCRYEGLRNMGLNIVIRS